MKKLFLFLVCVCLSVTTFAFTYKISDNDDGTCCITGVDGELKGDVELPDEINGIVVTSIGEHAFANCKDLTSVILSKGLRNIEVGAFFGCSSLVQIVIPNGVTNISGSAFRNCSSLVSLNVPDSVRSIGNSAMDGCASSLYDSVTFKGLVLVDGWVIDYNNKCPSKLELTGIKGVAGGAFDKCAVLTSLLIHNDVTNIVSTAFRRCANLVSVILPACLSMVEMGVFYGCSSMQSITIPSSVKYIDYMAFVGCTALATVIVDKDDATRIKCLLEDSGTDIDFDKVTFVEKDEDNLVPEKGWPEWVLGDWKGNVVNVVPHSDGTEKTVNGIYVLTLTTTGSKECYEFEDGEICDCTDDMLGWKITEKADCHIVATAWCWDDEEDDKFDAKYVFRNPNVNCSHYSNSTFYQEMRKGGDMVECSNLVKDGGTSVPSGPYVPGDDGAKIEVDTEKGYIITPSEGAKEVKVSIPDGVDAAKVTVKVSPEAKVTPNGAAVKVVKGGHDITDYLDIPAKDASGVIDLSAATVKEEYVKEPFNVEKGAKIDLSSTTEPSFTTAPTQKGLTYRLKEGTTLEEMRADTDGDSKIGDGNPWTPTISQKGGTSAFYTIEVTK